MCNIVGFFFLKHNSLMHVYKVTRLKIKFIFMNKIVRIILLLATISNVYSQNNKLLVRNVTIIPLHINQQWENKDVVVFKGKIIAIRNHDAADTSKYDLGIIEGDGKYLVPAFADAHVHLPEKENLKHFFLMNLINGVTTLRSMRGEMWHLEINKNEEFTPNLILSSPPISKSDTLSETAAIELFSMYKKSGFQFVKILSISDEQTFDNIVAASKENDLYLAGHYPSNIDILKVYESNVFQSIEHLGGFSKDSSVDEIISIVNLSVANNTYHNPTLDWYFTGQIPESDLRKRDGVAYLPSGLVNNWERKISEHYLKTTESERLIERNVSKIKFQTKLKTLGSIYTQGGKLLLSPDASGIYNIPGFGVHSEMKHYRDAGISNYDILKAACYNLSEMLGSQNDWGTIKIGSSPDMVLLDKNPLENIDNSVSIYGIVFNGQFYLKSDLTNKLNAE